MISNLLTGTNELIRHLARQYLRFNYLYTLKCRARCRAATLRYIYMHVAMHLHNIPYPLRVNSANSYNSMNYSSYVTRPNDLEIKMNLSSLKILSSTKFSNNVGNFCEKW